MRVCVILDRGEYCPPMPKPSPQESRSAKDDSIVRFNPPQARTVAIQGLVVVVATMLSGLRGVTVGISAWWLVPLALLLYILVLCIDVSVEVTATEIAVWPWLGQLAHLAWQHRYPLWAL